MKNTCKTAAVTGASGFVGRNLLRRLLAEGIQVRVLTRHEAHARRKKWPEGVAVHRGDLEDPHADFTPFLSGADVLFHCAGEVQDEHRMRAVHVEGTQRLCRQAQGKIGHWVQLSSVGAYGPQRKGCISEDDPLHPCGPYETTKTAAEKVVMAIAHDQNGFSYTILRPSNIYGPDMTNTSLFQMINMVRNGFFCFIGKPGAMANYIHIDNVAEALFRCGVMSEARGCIFNVSAHRSMEAFVGIISAALGCRTPRLRLPEKPLRLLVPWIEKWIPGIPLTVSRIDALTTRAVYSHQRIAEVLAYASPVSMEEGITELTRQWLQSRG